ncbi:hypothetical protein FJZ22_01075 [Candidatus Pacearchaeota archaeon]|nr:hypothetical protein [Candidatus Pacearchaeota archaeon]
MHRARQNVTRKIPIVRKGTKYVAMARSHIDNAIPVVIAIRDMLGLAKTAKEVREMIKQKKLKVNGRTVVELNESIQLFHLLEADKTYQVSLSLAGRFTFLETKAKDRLAKIISRSLISGGKVQLHLHDGTNIIGKKEHAIQDSVYLDAKNKPVKHVSFTKGSKVLATAGKYIGQEGKITSYENGVCTVQFESTQATIPARMVVAL